MATADSNFHVVFLPFFTNSHMMPLVYAARVFAARGVRSTIITTVHNARIFQTSVDRDIADGYPIAVNTLVFPASEVGLPVGVENYSLAVTPEMNRSLYHGIMLLQKPMEQLIRDLAPDCIFSDMYFPWTVDLAHELEIPRILFYPGNVFAETVEHSLKTYAPHANVKSESESFLVPNLPDVIMLKRSQIAEYHKTKTMFGELMNKLQESEKPSYGLVYNTFYEMEPAYIDHLKKVKQKKIWHIGPLFQYFSDSDNRVSVLKHNCLNWLDNQKPESVIYVCFGSMVRFSEAQITEIALALEECKQPFVWVVREEKNDEGIGGMPDGFEERILRENKGFIINGWAPQVSILQHPATGGFLTHCGGNSIFEAVVMGVPLVTWPLFSEQFNNEKWVEILGIGVAVGSEVWNPGFEIVSPIIEKQKIVEGIRKLFCGSTLAESIRSNVKELSIKAKNAVKEGGSSFDNVTDLIEDLKAFKVVSKA